MNRACRIGVHGRNDINLFEVDFKTILEAKIETIKLLSFTKLNHFRRIKEQHPNIELITRLYDDRFGPNSHPTPEQFAQRMVPVMRQIQPFCTKFEIHNEPNHVDCVEGWGDTDTAAHDFNGWFLRAYAILKSQCPWAQLGFPGLAIPHRDLEWIELCRPAVEQADWLGVHCYWQTPPNEIHNHLSDFWGLRFKYYHQKFPAKTIDLTEVGSANIQNGHPLTEDSYAREVTEYFAECFKYPYLNSASLFILSSPSRSWNAVTWRSEDSRLHKVVWAVRDMRRPYWEPVQQSAQTQVSQPPSNDNVQVKQLQAQNVQLQAQIQQLQNQTSQLHIKTQQLHTNLAETTKVVHRAATTEPTGQPARQPTSSPSVQTVTVPMQAATASVTPPPVQNIAQKLVKRPAISLPQRDTSQIDRIIVHHTGTPPTVTAEQIAAFLVKRGQAGINYHYFVTGNGLIQQTNDLTAVIAQSANFPLNQVSLAVGFAGNFNQTAPPPAQIEAGAHLIAWLIRQLNLSIQAVFGYKELIAAQSPGNQWDTGAVWGNRLRQSVWTYLTGAG